MRDFKANRIFKQKGLIASVYYFLPQSKGYLGVHSPPYGGEAFLCLLLLLSLMSLCLPHHSVCHFVFFYVNYFYHLTILSIIV